MTVTHPDVIRYFMTIPEAAQLVIQAGSMAKGGDVFVLDMGRPVRIDDLARRMVSLMGFTVRDAAQSRRRYCDRIHRPAGPAEKLFEELLIGSNVMGTDHPMILRAMEHRLPWLRMQQILHELQLALAASDCHRVHVTCWGGGCRVRLPGEWRSGTMSGRVGAPLPAADAKIADFAAKRRSSEATGEAWALMLSNVRSILLHTMSSIVAVCSGAAAGAAKNEQV